MPLGSGTQKRWKILIDYQLYDLKTSNFEHDLTGDTVFDSYSIPEALIYVINNNVYKLHRNQSNYLIDGVNQYLYKKNTFLNLNAQVIPDTVSFGSGYAKSVNNELYLYPQGLDLYGFAAAKLIRFNFDTNAWSDTLAPSGIISSLTYCFKITATARMMDIGNKSFPAESYTVKKYPGLTR